MSRCCVALGPNDSYLFSVGNQWRCQDLPADLLDLFARGLVRDVYEAALGPAAGSYALSYLDPSGARRIARRGLPADLDSWLAEPGRDLDTLQFSLGPRGAFFAFDKHGVVWDALSPEFEAQLAAMRGHDGRFRPGKYPAAVSFGPAGDFVMVSADGCAAFSLDDAYDDGIKNLLVQKQFYMLEDMTIVLNPSRVGTYMILSGSGTAEGAFPPKCIPHFQAFANEWKVACHNKSIHATNDLLRKYSHGGSCYQLPYAQAPPALVPHVPASNLASAMRPVMHGLHAIHQMNSQGNSGGMLYGGGGGGGINSSGGGSDIYSNLVNASNNGILNTNGSSGGSNGTDLFNTLLNASNGNGMTNTGSDPFTNMLGNANGLSGSFSGGMPDPSSAFSAASSFFDPTSFLAAGALSWAC